MNLPSRNLRHGVRRTREALQVFVVMVFALCLGSAGAYGTTSRFAYVADANGISIYTVNLTSGQLRSDGYVFAAPGFVAVAVDPSERFVYALNIDTNTISAYTINAISGGLTAIAGSPYATESGPVSVTVDPSGQFVYVANNNSNNVSAYAINAESGTLTSVNGSPFPSGQGPASVTIDPSGQFAYVGNENDSPGGDVSGYTIDATTGSLTAMNGSPFLSGSGAFAIAIAPSGKFGYVGAGQGALVTAFSINPTTGIPTMVAGSPFLGGGSGSYALAVNASSKVVYALGGSDGNNISAFTVNDTTGKLKSLKGSPFAAGDDPLYATVDPRGTRLYVRNCGSDEVWTYKMASSGALTVLDQVRTPQGFGPVALDTGSSAVTYTPKFAYVANSSSNNISAYTIDAKNGHITPIGGSPFEAGTTPYSVAVDPSGRFAYAANEGSNSVSAYTINASTGALTAISGSLCPTGPGPDSITVDPSGHFVYVANAGSGNPNVPSVSACTIDASTGALTAVGGSPFATGGANTISVSVTVDPTGQFVYVANLSLVAQSGDISAFAINAGSGGLSAVTGSPFGGGNVNTPNAVAVDASGRFAYVANGEMIGSSYVLSSFSINPSTGALSFVSYSSSLGGGTQSVATDPLGQFVYTAQLIDGVLGLSFDSSTDAFTLLSDSACPSNPLSVAIDPSGKYAYAANPDPNNTITACTIGKTTGDLNPISGETGVAAGTNPVSVVTTGTIQ
jgi:6-phosphogluconolactonase